MAKMHDSASKRILSIIVAGLSVAAITAAAKSYVDVQILKTKHENIREIVTEIRSDVKSLLKNRR